MKFEHKIFLATFALCSIVCSLAGYTIYKSMEGNLIATFHERYQTLSATVASTFNQLDQTSDRFIESSIASVVHRLSESRVLPTNEDLKRIRNLTGLTSVDLIQRDGTFIRSSSFPEYGSNNLYSYCESHHRVFSGEEALVRTPIMPSLVFGKGVKFFLLALPGSKYAVNVGYQLDLIGQNLSRALSSDPNIKIVGLYTPSGKKLGEYAGPDGVTAALPTFERDDLIITTKVKPTETYCCECMRNGSALTNTGEYFYVLKMAVSQSGLHLAVQNLRTTTIAVLLLSLLLSLIATKLIAHSLTSRLNMISVRATEIMTSRDLNGRIGLKGRDEIFRLAGHFDAMLDSLETAQEDLLRLEKDKTFAEVASQVSHDIRSPLTALQLLLGQVSDWPEQQRILARSAIARITDIANSLLDRSKQKLSSAENINHLDVLTTELAPAILESLISEARLRAREIAGLEIDLQLAGSYGSFIKINVVQFKRAISNLINNACEAIEGRSGSVTIGVKRESNSVQVSVVDDGKGMPEQILKRLGSPGITFGKIKSQSGSGLGVYHAKKTVEDAGGRFCVASKEGVGTAVQITLPVAPAPDWFVERVLLREQGTIVSVDDDRAIHQIWKERLNEAEFFKRGGRHIEFNSVAEVLANSATLKSDEYASCIILLDYELGAPGTMTGLDLIKQLGIVNRSILVTSRYEESSIRLECERLGVKLIPKGMAPLVPFSWSSPGVDYSTPVSSFRAFS